METGATSELAALKTKLRATWIAGDFGEIAKFYASQAEDFIKRLNLKPGMKVLDVACGTGNLAFRRQGRARLSPASISRRTWLSRHEKMQSAKV